MYRVHFGMSHVLVRFASIGNRGPWKSFPGFPDLALSASGQILWTKLVSHQFSPSVPAFLDGFAMVGAV